MYQENPVIPTPLKNLFIEQFGNHGAEQQSFLETQNHKSHFMEQPSCPVRAYFSNDENKDGTDRLIFSNTSLLSMRFAHSLPTEVASWGSRVGNSTVKNYSAQFTVQYRSRGILNMCDLSPPIS